MGAGARQQRFLKENFSFSGLQWSFWSAFGVLIEFLGLFMRRNGLEDIYIGTVMSVVSFAGIIGQPVLGYLCDRTHAIKQVITICLVISGGPALLFPAELMERHPKADIPPRNHVREQVRKPTPIPSPFFETESWYSFFPHPFTMFIGYRGRNFVRRR